MNKIKAINPQIVVHGTVDKPYYEICYYNIAKKEWCVGYSSYDLKNVVGWLNECFEVSESDVAPVIHGHWICEYLGYDAYRYKCSVCGGIFGESMIDDFNHNKYCSDCGAKMGGEDK